MAVYVTGDIHGNPTRLSKDSFYEQKDFSGNKDENTVIILGDFGLVWNRDGESKQEKYWLDWLNQKPFTIVFVDGNHENHKRLATYSVKEWRGGKVHEVRSNILHLMRGEVFTIENKKFFAFGGASSHDIQDGILDYNDENWREEAKKLDNHGKYMYRIKDLSWWEEELPTDEEMQHGLDVLKENNNLVDYIITHSPSTSELYLIRTVEDDYFVGVDKRDKHVYLFSYNNLNQLIFNDRQKCLDTVLDSEKNAPKISSEKEYEEY